MPAQLFPTVTDLTRQTDVVRRNRYGVIEIAEGEFQSIRFRPWPKWISRLELATWGRWAHGRSSGDRCWLYYNAPLSAPGFLTLAYIVSPAQTRWSTIRTGLEILDQVAEIRRTNALVCELSNLRISDRLMGRLGWEEHCPHLSGRHFIKRFYGEYPKRSHTSVDRGCLAGSVCP